MKTEIEMREDVIRVCQKLEQKGLIAALDGNVSCRAGEGRLLITPGGKPKGELRPMDLLLIDLKGRILRGRGRVSSEIRMHLFAYGKRPEVQAVVHAHPPMLTAFTLSGTPFAAEALPELWLTIGPVPTAPYATPTTDEVPRSIAPFIEEHQAILLERHGSLTVGKTVMEAYLRLEKLEHAAWTLFLARQLAGQPPAPLPPPALAKLDALRVREI